MAADDKKCSIQTVACLSGIVVILLVCWIAYSHFEAASYNKITGANVSTWDAMFLTLTVQSGPATDYQTRERKPDSADEPQGDRDPRQSYYFSDGLRAVMFFVTRPVALSEVQLLDWVPYLQSAESEAASGGKTAAP